MPARAQAAQGQGDEAGQLAAGAAYENGVRVRPALKPFRRLAQMQAVVAHAKGGVVLRGNGVIGLVFFNGPHVALRAQARRFQAHGAGGRANVPHHAVGAQLHARQAQGARFQLGDQALFGLALRVSRVGQAKAHGLRRGAAAPEDDDVQRREIHARRFLRGQLGMHALARLQEVFGHGHQKVIAQPFGQQHAGDARGRVAGAGEHQKPLVRAHGLRQRVKAVAGGAAALPLARVFAVNGDDARVLPSQPQPRASHLQGGEIGQHAQRVHAQMARQIRRNAVAQRIARGQHHAALAGLARGLRPPGHLRQLPGEIALRRARLELVRQKRQRARAANDEIGRAHMRQRRGRQTGRAIIEHANDEAGIGIGMQ